MKSERRHELKESDLVHVLDETRDFVRNHGTRIGIGAIVVIGAVVVSWLMIRQRQAAAEDLWRSKTQLTSQLASATPMEAKESLRRLMQMAADAGNDQFARQALIDQGSQSLRMANEGDVIPDTEYNDLARDAYERLLDRFGKSHYCTGIAHLGLATVAENDFALNGDPSHKQRARQHLEKITQDTELHTLPMYQLALDRLGKLDETLVEVVFAPPLPPPAAPVAPPGPPSPTAAAPSTTAPATPAPITIDTAADDDPGGPVLTPISADRVPDAVKQAMERQRAEKAKELEEEKQGADAPTENEEEAPGADSTDPAPEEPKP